MDPFRLLSRSTNLHKSGGVHVHHIPSAADSGHIQKSGNGVAIDGAANSSKKRKRFAGGSHRAPGAAQPDAAHNDVAYFSEHDDTTKSLTTTTTNGQRNNPAGKGTGAATSNQEEWRKVLKQHRVKVTLLEAGTCNEPESKDMHKRHRGTDEDVNFRAKRVHVQLTSRPLQTFSDLFTEYSVSKRIGVNLDAQGYTTPTDVQLGTIPILLGTDSDRGLYPGNSRGDEGHRRSHVDLLTVAPTGSGKTLAFLIHLLRGLRERHPQEKIKQDLNTKRRSAQALILAPTHELVDQIVLEGKKLAFGTSIRISRLRKGMNLGPDGIERDATGSEATLEKSVGSLSDAQLPEPSTIKADILVSTPALLLHAVTPSPEASLNDIRYLVLDEADVLLDPMFRQQTLDVWSSCTNPHLQTSLWSATIGSSIEALAQDVILDRRRKLRLDIGSPKHHIVRLVVGLKDSAIPNISHQLVYTATESGKLMALRQLIHPAAASVSKGPSLQPPFLIFTQTIQRAAALHSELLYDVPVEAGGSSRVAVLHSELSDKTRSTIMAGFRKGEIWILITTDLLARGVDFRGVNGVVNYDIPNTSGIYIHRVGRTGRQGREGGVAVTLYTKEDIKYVKNVANVIAASEKQRRKTTSVGEDDSLQEWLLNALPDVSKKTKRELKRKGVEARRTTTHGNDKGKAARRMRISTKSGYDRRLEHNRKGAAVGSQRHSMKESSDDEWDGIEG